MRHGLELLSLSLSLVALAVIGHVPPQVTSDERRLASVLDALLSNAVEFSPSGEVVLRVWMENIVGEEVDTYDHKDLVLCFAVSDAGPGISAELAQRVSGVPCLLLQDCP